MKFLSRGVDRVLGQRQDFDSTNVNLRHLLMRIWVGISMFAHLLNNAIVSLADRSGHWAICQTMADV